MGTEKERDEAQKEAQIAQLAIVAADDVKAWVKDDLTKVQVALAIAEEARHKAEAANLEVGRTSLLHEIGVAKDEVSSLQS